MAGPKHSCGVVGINAENNVVPALQKSLMIIQHRGQESAGISVFNSEGAIDTIKDSGLVQTALPKYVLSKLHGTVGIGHVRYPAGSRVSESYAEPLMSTTRYGPLAIAHNGDITNFDLLKEKYLISGSSFFTSSDSELITKILGKHSAQYSDPVKALKATCAELDGAFSLVLMIGNRLFGIRDPRGMRPLCIGKIRDGYMLVSESAAIDALNGELIRDVMPGEIVEITRSEIISYPYNTNAQRAHCMFEWVYFARPDSVIDGREVYDVRRSIGEILARECTADVDLIMPIPDSGRAHAIGFSVMSRIPYEEGFMKNRFAERTFILPDQRLRETAVSTKMNPIKSTVNGKRILIVDDSIVRGTTLKKLISMLRSSGAKEVHVRIGCPPIIAPCYYGVDMKTRDQIIGADHTVEQIRQVIGADSLAYISIEGLIEALKLPERDVCTACVSGKYPTMIPGEIHRYQSTLKGDF
ncbi:MAG TPA: amidophosphoribosyltransferase [Candidatus Methanomethylophilaceae archaeon]|nr:amidophosphoribosyltransferase [Candidatus Methanomethylophilaceae archaeon]